MPTQRSGWAIEQDLRIETCDETHAFENDAGPFTWHHVEAKVAHGGIEKFGITEMRSQRPDDETPYGVRASPNDAFGFVGFQRAIRPSDE